MKVIFKIITFPIFVVYLLTFGVVGMVVANDNWMDFMDWYLG